MLNSMYVRVYPPSKSFLTCMAQVTKDSLNFKNKISPYVGLKLRGRVEKTFLRGSLVYDRENGFDGVRPIGQLL